MKFLDLLREYEEDLGNVDAFRALRLYARGKIGSYELRNYIPQIRRVEESSSDIRGEDMLFIEFDSESDFFGMLGVSDDDEWFAGAVESGYDHTDYYSYSQHFEEGYHNLDDLNEDNLKKLDIISKKLVSKPFLDLKIDDDSFTEFTEKLKSLFPRQYENILDDFISTINEQVRNSASEMIEKDVNAILKEMGMTLVNPYWLVKTSVVNLITLYASSRKMRGDLKSLFEDLGKSKDNNFSWGEDTYSLENYNLWDWDSLNRRVEWQLDNILDTLSEDENLNNFVDFVDRVTAKFKIGSWYAIPKNREYRFKIDRFDPETMKVNVHINKLGDYRQKSYSFTEEGLNNFLVQYELFPILNNENFYRYL